MIKILENENVVKNTIRTFGNSGVVRKKFPTGTEEEFIRSYEGREGYSGLYTFYNLPKGPVKKEENILKEYNLVFDRLVFDFDCDENPFEAIKQGIKLRDWFKEEFKELYSEIWFSGNKGAHVYIYFNPIDVNNPKAIYSHIAKTLKNELGFNLVDTNIIDVYSRLFRVKNSKHPKSGYYKVNITYAVDMGRINSIEDVYRIGENPTAYTRPQFNTDPLFNEFIVRLSESVESNALNYDDNKQYTCTGDMGELKTAFTRLFKEGQMNTVSYPLIHMFRRANVPIGAVQEFFKDLDCDYQKVLGWIKVGYNTLGRVCGLRKLKEVWLEAGATEQDLQAVYNFFTISDDVFYPYKPNLDDIDLILPSGWEVVPNKEPTTVFKVKKDNVVLSFDVRGYLIVNGRKIKNDKRSLVKDLENYDLTEIEVLDLEYSKNIYVNNKSDDYKVLQDELNRRLSSNEKKKTAQTILNYFANRQGYSTPKGIILMGTDNVGRPMTKNELKSLLNKDFQPKNVITSDLLSYIDDLPEREPTYNILKVANGFYDFNTGEFKTKAEKPIIVFKTSPYNYNEELIGAPIPKDLQLLFDNLYKTPVTALLEVMGYLLTDGNPLKIVPIFIGDNDTGKTVIMEIMGALLNNNTSAVDIFNLELTDIGLITKDLNLISEFRKTTGTALSALKDYTGDARMDFKKLYNDPKTYDNHAISKTILSTNNFTGLSDCMDASVVNRFNCWIEFKKNYTEKDTEIKNRIINNSEVMDWLLTNSIHAYTKSNGKLQANHTKQETRQLIDRYDDPMGNLIIEKYDYIENSDWNTYTYNVTGNTVDMDAREWLEDYGVTVSEVRQLYEDAGCIAPRQITRPLKELFEVKNIHTRKIWLNKEWVSYVVGLVRKN